MIIIMGVVGSGKSEQGHRLAVKLNCPWISTSELLRRYHTSQIQKQMAAGKLVDDQEVIALLDQELKKLHADKEECILDGSPRSIPQAQWLMQKVKIGEIKLTAIIRLKVSKDVVLERLLKRGRDDDQKEIISERFREYDRSTGPVVDYLKEQGISVHEIDGEAPPEVVEKNIHQILNF